MRRNSRLFLSACIFLGSFVCFGKAGAQEPGELLANYAAYLDSLPNWRVESTTDIHITGAYNDDRHAKHTYTYFKRGHDYDVVRDYEKFNEEGERTGSGSRFRVVALGDNVYDGYGLGQKSPWTVSPRPTVETTAHGSLNLGGGEGLEGYLAGDGVPVPQLLQGAPLLRVESTNAFVGGVPCHYLIGEVEGRGTYELWLSPQHQWAALRARVTKTGDDFYWDKPLSATYPGYNSPGRFPSHVIASLNWEMDDVAFTVVDGFQVPLACRVTYTKRYPDGESTTFSKVHRRDDIDLSPSFDNALANAIPEGAEVQTTGSIPQFYVRQGEELVPSQEVPEGLRPKASRPL